MLINRVLICDKQNHAIRKISFSKSPKVLTCMGKKKAGATNGGSDKAEFNFPVGVACVGETILIADSRNHCIRMALPNHIEAAKSTLFFPQKIV
jgi:hypothetical protein